MTHFVRFSEKHPIISVVIVSAVCFFLSLPIVAIAASFGCSADTAAALSETFEVLASCVFCIPILLRAIRLEMKKCPRRYILIALYGFLAFNFCIAAIMSITAL